MKAAVLYEPGRVPVVDLDEPRSGPGEVVVRIRACGVCGTDNSLYRGVYPASYPVVIGHEFAGEIAEVGPGVQALKVGDRVTADPNVLCGTCDYCRIGAGHLCENLSSMGVHRHGADAEYAAVPASNVYRIPDSLSFEEAAFCEPLACAVHGVSLGNIQLGDTVLIIGGGAMGNLIAQCVARCGAARIIASEPLEFRRNKMLESGATHVVDPGRSDLGRELRSLRRIGADVVFEVAGNPKAQAESLSLVRKGGTIVLFGVSPAESLIEVSPFDINENELRVIGSFNNPSSTGRAVELLGRGICRVTHLISHRINLSEYETVFGLFGQKETLKLMVYVA